MADFTRVDGMLDRYCAEGLTPSASLAVFYGEKEYMAAYGSDPGSGCPVGVSTRFDVASLTKLFTATAFMTLVKEGIFSLDEKLRASFPSFAGRRLIRGDDNSGAKYCDAGTVNWRHILTHTSGLGNIALYKYPSPREAFEAIEDMPFDRDIGSGVLYTDIGFILLGRAMELRTGLPLDAVIHRRVCLPLGLCDTGYLRLSAAGEDAAKDTAPTEFCAWRNRRIHGQVHDENAFFLDGVAGHAGIFSTARDTAAFCRDYLRAYKGEKGLLTHQTVRDMTRVHDERSRNRRGLGWQLRNDDPAYHSCPLSVHSFGHTGFTGTCMWVDPARDMAFALFTNEVYYGRQNRRFMNERVNVVRELVRAVDDTI